MTKTRAWPVKVMYLLMAAALAISLIITVAPARMVSANSDVKAEWDEVSTPTMEGLVLAPDSDIIDIAVAQGGDTAYATLAGSYETTDGYHSDYWLLKSEDGAATWKNLNEDLEDEFEEGEAIDELLHVACDAENPDFLAVVVVVDGEVRVFISEDGGDTFEDAGEVEILKDKIFAFEVSPEADGDRDIAIGGTDGTHAELWRSTATGDSASKWEDATAYDGWVPGKAVVDIRFAPSWETDNTILVATATDDTVHLQFGTWGTSEGWNEDSVLGINALPIVSGFNIPWSTLKGATAGISTPLDYSGRNSDGRYAWVNVNYKVGGDETGKIFRVKNKSVMEVNQQIENTPWLTNVSYLGYIAEGKAIAGVQGDGFGGNASGCDGVQVYRNDGISDMDICCIFWDEACKPPTGIGAMAAFYVSADKAYAVALGGSSYDEGAWSFSYDDGDTWNQISLIDTQIDYLSDVAVSPDCNKTMAVSINLESGRKCDSVWLHAENLPEAEEYSDHWLRTWCGQLGDEQYGLLRLAPEETTGDTVYLVDRGTSTVYWNELETLACWNRGSSATVDSIVDLAVKDKETIYALGEGGKVAMSDDYAVGWHKAVDSEVDAGWTIAVHGEDILVGGQDGKVSHSDDGGETFTELEKKPSIDGYVTVAFDSYFDTNGTIYASVTTECPPSGGVYRMNVDEDSKWTDLGANKAYGYTGLVLDRPAPGNPRTSADTGGVLYASYVGYHSAGTGDGCNTETTWFTGVARYLTPAEDVVCQECGDWDYLTLGLTENDEKEAFYMMPKALKICGCLTPDTNSKLFTIDGLGNIDGLPHYEYDVSGKIMDGAVWMFEDCYGKKAPEITGPEDGEVIDADPCACYNRPFTVSWDRLCDACVYDIEFSRDEDFTSLVSAACAHNFTPSDGAAPAYEVPGKLVCEFTYYYRVRAIKAENCQQIRSWWSVPRSVTIAPSLESAKIELKSPAPGAKDMPTKNVGFSWSLAAEADAFDWVLKKDGTEVASATALNDTYHQCTVTLEYNTTYTWQVMAYSEGTLISRSDVGTFYTAVQGEFCCPVCGLCFDTQEELEAHSAEAHPAQPVTPAWVWVIIAIGAVLVIVVIILIFRTRRV